jgi:hypothetical protein
MQAEKRNYGTSEVFRFNNGHAVSRSSIDNPNGSATINTNKGPAVGAEPLLRPSFQNDDDLD